MKVSGWRIWYIGGEIYDSKTTIWADLLKDNVLEIMLYFDTLTKEGFPLRRAISGADVYFKAGEVYGSAKVEEYASVISKEKITLAEAIQQVYPGAVVLYGRWTTDEEITQVDADAMKARTL